MTLNKTDVKSFIFFGSRTWSRFLKITIQLLIHFEKRVRKNANLLVLFLFSNKTEAKSRLNSPGVNLEALWIGYALSSHFFPFFLFTDLRRQSGQTSRFMPRSEMLQLEKKVRLDWRFNLCRGKVEEPLIKRLIFLEKPLIKFSITMQRLGLTKFCIRPIFFVNRGKFQF